MKHVRIGILVVAGLAVPAVPGGEPDATASSGWQMLWHDEFDLQGVPDKRFWSHEVNCWGGGNNERQCYTDRLDNAYVGDDGLLHIVAREEFFTGPALQDDHPDYPGQSVSRSYTSARLRTRDKVDWKYGRIEVRAQLPGGQGMWPAIWMLPTDWRYGGWPSSGEIDIVEGVNLARGDFAGWGDVVHGTLHYGLKFPQWENHGWTLLLDGNPADAFHVYALEWEPDEIRWYVDDVHYQTQTSKGWYNYIWGGQDLGFVVATDRAPYDQRFHLLLNVAVGGDWPGAPDTGWDSDREMLVDYVRIYQCTPGLRHFPGNRGVPRSRSRVPVENRTRACRTADPSTPVNSDFGGPGVFDFPVYQAGPAAPSWEVWLDGEPTLVENHLVPGSFASSGVEVISGPQSEGPWEVEFRRTGPLLDGGFVGNVFLGSSDMQHVDGVGPGFNLYGGTGWTNNGELEFDVEVLDVDPETRLFVKMDSGYPSVGSVEIDIPGPGRVRHVSVRLSELLANRGPGETQLAIDDIRNVFVLESTGPARLRIDNIRLQCAFNREPEPWQVDKVCGVAPKP